MMERQQSERLTSSNMQIQFTRNPHSDTTRASMGFLYAMYVMPSGMASSNFHASISMNRCTSFLSCPVPGMGGAELWRTTRLPTTNCTPGVDGARWASCRTTYETLVFRRNKIWTKFLFRFKIVRIVYKAFQSSWCNCVSWKYLQFLLMFEKLSWNSTNSFELQPKIYTFSLSFVIFQPFSQMFYHFPRRSANFFKVLWCLINMLVLKKVLKTTRNFNYLPIIFPEVVSLCLKLNQLYWSLQKFP